MIEENQELDRTIPDRVVNFRDVGTWVNLIASQPLLPEGRLYRGGTIRHLDSLKAIDYPRTIFNLEKTPDREFPNVANFHFPVSKDHEKYDTCTREIRMWLKSIVRNVETGFKEPLLVHCFSGKDSTGVVVAGFLLILGIDTDVIVEEYLLSDGKVSKDQIIAAIEGIRDIEHYFSGIDLDIVKRHLTSER